MMRQETMMAQYQMKLLSRFFTELRDGRKSIELRCNDAKRRRIVVGDSILFTDLTTGEQFSTTVKDLEYADSFYAIISSHSLDDFGFDGMDMEEALDILHKIYPPEQEEALGVVGIHIEPIHKEVRVG